MGNKKGSFVGLLPLIIFVILYIISTILTGNASTMPLNTGILIAIICAFVFCAMRKKDENTMSFDDLVTSFCKGGGDDTLILMFFIFLEAGIFSGVANAMGAVSSASNLGLKLLPASMVLPGIFIIGCVLSFAMGTSMGTVSALMPIGIQIANVTGMSMPMVCGAVVGGAMFGDNLSFISDTTIAATRTQGVAMKDKFKANFLMVLPAVLNIGLLFCTSAPTALDESALTWDFIQLIPYILVIVLSLIGINVILAMGAGIAAGLIIGIAQGSFSLAESLTVVGNGIISMEDTAVIAVMVGGLVALMHYLGGIQWLLNSLSRSVKSRSGAELSIAALVTLLDLATTNNTISIITAGPIAKDISQKYGVSPVRAASILDLFSSAGNGVCPWAGQILAASGLAGVSTLSIVPFCWYSIMMFIFGVIFILIGWPKGIVKNTEQAPAAK